MITTESVVSAIINKKHGWAVAEQFESTFSGEEFGKCNFNALNYIRSEILNILRSDVLSEDAYDELHTYCDDLEDYIVGAE